MELSSSASDRLVDHLHCNTPKWGRCCSMSFLYLSDELRYYSYNFLEPESSSIVTM
jgi:hypothetical protein